MSWWIVDFKSINEDGTEGLCDIECDTAASLPAADQTLAAGIKIVRGSKALDLSTGDRYKMNSSGSWVQQPSEYSLDLAGYATEQYVDAGLSAKVDTATYTAGQAAQNAEISVIADQGSKNLLRNTAASGSMEIRTVQFTINDDGSVDISAGTVTGGNADLSINASVSGLVAGASYILSGCPAGGSAAGYRLNLSGVGADTGSGLEFTYEGSPINVYIRVSNGYMITSPITFKPMIRRAEITDGAYAPYAPTNRELYEMILALQ